ncbi:MAG: SEC-C domain-containing protein [Sciscionella sp.]
MPPTDAWQPCGFDGEYQYSTVSMLTFWPEPEYAILVTRWPYLLDHVGTTWDEHRRTLERNSAFAMQQGLTVGHASADVAGFEAFLAERNVQLPSAADLHAYPEFRSNPALRPWPPARTEPCWCGSGRKYKQCCRPHGLGSLD